MDIGRVLRVKKDQLDLDSFQGDGAMNINGITVTEGSNSVVLALNNGIEKIVIKSDFKSLENYAAQRKIEEKIYLKQRTQGIPNVDADNLPIWGMEKKDASWIRKAGSVIADFIPYVGTSKAVSELIFGYDYIGGEEISRVVAACAVIGSLVPVPGGAREGKIVGTALKKFGPQLKTLWTPNKYMGSVQNAFYHFRKHGKEFPGIQNAKQYVEKTKNFIKFPPKDTLIKVRSNGDKIIYHEQSNTFAVATK